MTAKSMKDRIKICQRAILNLRKKKMERELGPSFGCIGILDYVESGIIERILHPGVRREVKKLLASLNNPEKRSKR